MDNIDALWRQAEAMAGEQRWMEAKALYALVADLAPGRKSEALLQLSYIESLQGGYRGARKQALVAAEAYSGDAEVAGELLSRLRTFNEPAAFHRTLDRLPPRSRITIPQLISIAAQLSYHNEQDKALSFLDEAIRGDPDYPPTLVARGQVLMYLGRFDAAYDDLVACVRRAPEIAQAWWLLSRLGRSRGADARVDAMLRQLAGGTRSADQIAVLSFALHNELDAQGEHAPAWRALDQACRAKRSLLRYDAGDVDDLVEALIAMQTRPAADAGSPIVGSQPIFIVGMHRSGTTLLEQLLDQQPDVIGLGELYDFTQQMRLATDYHCKGVLDAQLVRRASAIDFRAVGAAYLAGTAWRASGHAHFVDKLPSNFLNLGFICQALPQARILHLRRDPMETCFSNLRELFSDACPYSYDQQELARYFGQYRRLMRHWHTCFPGRILDIDYARLVTDTEGEMARVAAFCGLSGGALMTDPGRKVRGVATASAVQVRQAIKLPPKPKWEAYAEYLEPLRLGLS